MRKLPQEIAIMRQINKISQQAHLNIMKNAKPNMNEAELETFFNSSVHKHGIKHLAYNSIVAGDDRGATLHYIHNDKAVKDGSLVLVDAGAELNCYASDITRTFPINGKFTAKQRAIYDIVLKANKVCVFFYIQLITLDCHCQYETWCQVGRFASHGGAHHLRRLVASWHLAR